MSLKCPTSWERSRRPHLILQRALWCMSAICFLNYFQVDKVKKKKKQNPLWLASTHKSLCVPCTKSSAPGDSLQGRTCEAFTIFLFYIIKLLDDEAVSYIFAFHSTCTISFPSPPFQGTGVSFRSIGSERIPELCIHPKHSVHISCMYTRKERKRPESE